LDRQIADALVGRASHDDAVTRSQRALGQAWEEYERLPEYPAELGLQAQARAALHKLNGVIDEQRRLLGQGQVAEADRFNAVSWRAASDEVDDALVSLVLLHVQHSREHAGSIDGIWRSSFLASLALGMFNLLLATGAGVITLSALRRHSRMQEERMDELNAFASRVAHDLLSPLSVVQLAIGVTARRVQEEDLQKHLGRASASVKRVQNIVDDLLAFARAGAQPDLQAHCASDKVVGGVVEELRPQAESARAELRAEPVAAVELACPEGVLTSVIQNLVRNALKFMDDAASPRRVMVRAVEEHGWVLFEVEDNGPGIPPGTEKTIFKPYVRGSGVRQSGLGLGLATVKRLVEAYGGSVGVRPASVRGSVFWFKLRRAAVGDPVR
jgi:signal transduction histidine kinase